MLGTFAALLVLWIFAEPLQIHPAQSALYGVSFLLVMGVLNWNDVINENGAWSTLVWFSIVLMMATYLGELGGKEQNMISWFQGRMGSAVTGMSWEVALAVLALVYYAVHYFFASVTVHISSLYLPFLILAIGADAPPMLSAMVLAVCSSLSGSLTHYGTGTAPVFYGAGYISVKEWWRHGAMIGLLNFLIFTTVGAVWWKVLGYW